MPEGQYTTNLLREGLSTRRVPTPCVLVIFGATGDLTHRKLVPALYNLAHEGQLPPSFAIVGFARRPKTNEEFRAELEQGVQEFSRFSPINPAVWKALAQGVYYHRSEFADDKGVYYFSTHQEGGYPGTGDEGFHGKSKNICNHLIAPGPEARGALMTYYREELPAAMDVFRPQFVLISCGFDAHRLDPIASLTLETEDYGVLTKCVRSIAEKWCDGRLLSVLEGGYDLDVIAQASVLHVRELSL